MLLAGKYTPVHSGGLGSAASTFSSSGSVSGSVKGTSKAVVSDSKTMTVGSATIGGDPNLTESPKPKPWYFIPMAITGTILTILGVRKLLKMMRKGRRKARR